MATKIEWADEVWNIVTGCSQISEGCQSCYAKRMAHRLRGRYGYPQDDPFRVTFHPDRLNQPLKWKKSRRIFVCSMSDLGHRKITKGQFDDIMAIIGECQWHTFLILTKRPEILKERLFPYYPWPNMWLGVSCENQQTADERIPILLQIPAAKRFVSLEPLLGPINLNMIMVPEKHERSDGQWHLVYDVLKGWKATSPYSGSGGYPKLDWVIAGCESINGRPGRPAKYIWFRDIKDQCVEAGIPFFLKQMSFHVWGESKPRIWKMPEMDGQRWKEVPG